MTQPANPWGNDMALTVGPSGQLDLEPTMRDVTGIQVLVQSLVARQTTATGSVLAVPDDCFDVRDWISKGMTTSEINQLGPQVEAELLKDERVQTVSVTAQFSLQTSTLILTELIRSAFGPFKLVLTLTASSVSYIISSQGLQ